MIMAGSNLDAPCFCLHVGEIDCMHWGYLDFTYIFLVIFSVNREFRPCSQI